MVCFTGGVGGGGQGGCLPIDALWEIIIIKWKQSDAGVRRRERNRRVVGRGGWGGLLLKE